MEQIRAFVAIELPDEIKHHLTQVGKILRRDRESFVKWADSDGIHLTLKFLGDIPSDQVANVSSAIESGAKGIVPFSLELQQTGAFPNLRSPRVAWVGVGGNLADLYKLQKNIETALQPLGFSPEKRQYSAHLTLGRVRERASQSQRADLGKALQTMKINDPAAFRVERVSLLQSKLTPGGAVYSRLAGFALDNE